MHCLFVLYFFISNLDLIPNFCLLFVVPPPRNVPSALKSMLLKGKEFCPIFAFTNPGSLGPNRLGECTQQISECTNSLRFYWTCNFRSYISLPTLQQSNKQILFIMTQSLQSLYLSKYYRRGRYLHALPSQNASHRLLLPAWRHFSFPRDTHGKPCAQPGGSPRGHPWPMTVRSQGRNLNPSEGPDGFEFISQGQQETHFCSGSPFFLLFALQATLRETRPKDSRNLHLGFLYHGKSVKKCNFYTLL